jgi:hypothetical protein
MFNILPALNLNGLQIDFCEDIKDTNGKTVGLALVRTTIDDVTNMTVLASTTAD